jgi:hypothetical protein
MLITALVAEALLGLLSLMASVTLASIVTAILLPWALVTVRRSALLSAVTLAMLGMLWRGEAWKTECLAAEAQMSREQQLRPQTASSGQFSWLARDGARSFSIRSRAASGLGNNPNPLHQLGRFAQQQRGLLEEILYASFNR